MAKPHRIRQKSHAKHLEKWALAKTVHHKQSTIGEIEANRDQHIGKKSAY